jgi:hypothetical protein
MLATLRQMGATADLGKVLPGAQSSRAFKSEDAS